MGDVPDSGTVEPVTRRTVLKAVAARRPGQRFWRRPENGVANESG
jgi:hypothetical protein